MVISLQFQAFTSIVRFTFYISSQLVSGANRGSNKNATNHHIPEPHECQALRGLFAS